MSVQLAALWSCKLHLPHLTISIGYRLSGIGPMSGKVGATCSSLELQVAPPAFTDTDEWASRFRFPPRFRFRIVLQNRPVRTEPRTSSPGSRTPLTMAPVTDGRRRSSQSEEDEDETVRVRKAKTDPLELERRRRRRIA